MDIKKSYFWALAATAALTTILALYLSNRALDPVPPPSTDILVGEEVDVENESEATPKNEIPPEEKINFILSDLSIPWEIVFLPDEAILVSERTGDLIKYQDGRSEKISIANVAAVGEGGLLGMVLHPDFNNNNYIYLYFTVSENNKLSNKIVRYYLSLAPFALTDPQEIIKDVPGSNNHNGGRIAFGPDEKLYVTTGDAGNANAAQNRDSLAGKILRLNDNGSIPADNPFGSAVWSYGHRNAQGLTWDDAGRLWATEHGRSGALSGLDELNLIEPGKNYGWPLIQGDDQQTEMIAPRLHSGAKTTWAPASLAYYDNYLYFAGLRGEALYAVPVNENGDLGDLETFFMGDYGRLRIVKVGPDNSFYLGTSNQDGRGRVRAGDDKIIKMAPNAWK
ncbi:MAG: PQQ-dependent sugar dehydrogenase [Candidatus Parcubacteria bacterium]|nr:MAG: PQQ-dependent sugar dehydrogenase [Candidatus Parcubacteria bacterium]